MLTMKKIAEAAGVSRTTVSYVLNGRHHEKNLKINPVTVNRVKTFAAEMGYRRNEIARSVRTGKTNVIGFVGGMDASYTMEIIKGMTTYCSKNNYLLKLLPLNYFSENIAEIAKQCVEQCLCGVISLSMNERCLAILHNELRQFNIPMVLVDSNFSHDWCSMVISDDVGGGMMATEHLIGLGHKKIVYISNNLNHAFSKKRYEGYYSAMRSAGLKMIKPIIWGDHGYQLFDDEKKEIEKLLQEYQPTAIFCGSDVLAMKTIQYMTKSGIKIPGELSLVGYAGLNYTITSTPPLTTVRQPFIEMGEKAAEVLISEVTRKVPIQEVKLPVKLIVRESTAAVNKCA